MTGGALAASAAALLAGCARTASVATAPTSSTTQALSGSAEGPKTTVPAATPVTQDKALHLALRLTYGLAPKLLDHVRKVGNKAFLEEQLAARTPGDLTKAFDLLNARAEDIDPADQAQRALAVAQLQIATVLRQVESPAQLYEQMVEFWSNHFAIFIFDGPQRLLKAVDDRDVIRPHALGRFADLLAATAHSPAMLLYLDNAQSTRGNLNENYGRELLELHTVGIDGGYTEADVLAAAKVFTGWGVGRGRTTFQFTARSHDDTPQRVMTWNAPVGRSGEAVGEDLLAHLARLPATARFLAHKLLVRFVADEPDPAYVDAVAKAYLAADTDISATLRALINDERFFSTRQSKYRRPNEFLVATLRATGGRITMNERKNGVQVFRRLLQSLGQQPFGWPAPNGYPDVAGAWQNAGGLLTRWNAAADIMANAIPALRVDAAALVPGAPTDPAATVDTLAPGLFGSPVDATTREAVLLGVASGVERDRLVPTIAALLVASPRFQYR